MQVVYGLHMIRVTKSCGSAVLLVGVVFAGASGFVGKSAAQDQVDPEEILTQLRAFDELYTSNLTVRGSARENGVDFGAAFNKPDANGSATWSTESMVSFTLKEGREAVIEDGRASYHNQSPPRGSELRRTVLVSVGDCVTLRIFTSADGSGENGSWITRKCSREQAVLRWFERQILWAIGRGFSHHLNEITSVAMNGAQLEIEATGRFINSSGDGMWTLLIDPTRSYLVTQAKYTAADGSPEMFEMRASDPVINGDCVFPSRSSVRPATFKTVEYEFTEATLTFDESLYDEAVAQINAEVSDGSVEFDYRTAGPKLVTIVGEKPPPVPAALLPPSEQAKRIRLWLILGNILLLAGVVAWTLIRRRRMA